MSDIPPDRLAAGDGEVVPETQAKQGRRGLHVFIVLLVSLILVVLALFGIWGLHAHSFGKLRDNGGQGPAKAAAAQQFSTPTPAPKQTPGPESAPATSQPSNPQ